jgi:hypothetical protein
VIDVGGTPPAQCPGTPDNPAATNGHVCIYLTYRGNAAVPAAFGLDQGIVWLKEGLWIYTNSSNAGRFHAAGTWAVTGS